LDGTVERQLADMDDAGKIRARHHTSGRQQA
jgi:hypothetical protein